MTASHNDSYLLSQDVNFQNRLSVALVAACISIVNEGGAVAYHKERDTFAAQVVNSPDTYKVIFARTVTTDANCLSDGTAAGTVVITAGNAATQAALITDAHIDTAISSQFNTFFKTPG